MPGPTEIRQLLEYVREARRDNRRPRPEFCEEGFLGNRFEGVVRPYLAQCRAGVTTGGILVRRPDWRMPELSKAFVQGDIRKERFKHVWETRYQNLRNRDWTHKGECANCEHYG